MIRSADAVLWAGLLLLAGGCSSVTVKEPIGQTAPPAELKALEGVWCNNDGAALHVRLTKSGNLLVGGLEWDEDKQTFRAETIRIIVTKIRELRLLYLPAHEEEVAEDAFLFCRYEFQDADTVRLYYPTVSVFQRAVESGRLSGTIKRHPQWRESVDVRIDAPADQVDTFFKESDDVACFDAELSDTYRRLGRVE